MRNMIQDMIDVGFEVVAIRYEEFTVESFQRYSVSIYSRDHFGIIYATSYDTLSKITFRNSINPWDYGDDYRILNKEEIETFNILLKAIEL